MLITTHNTIHNTGFSKRRLFEILDGLNEQSLPIMQQAYANLQASKGGDALQPYNTGFFTTGDVITEQSPYFPFEDAVDVWARSFAALGINYKGATMRLDLCDRDSELLFFSQKNVEENAFTWCVCVCLCVYLFVRSFV